MKRHNFLTLAATCLLSASCCLALNIPGADGSDGALKITKKDCTNGIYTIDLGRAATKQWDAKPTTAGCGVYDPEKWAVVFKYSSIQIDKGCTVKFVNHPSNPPVYWLVKGNVTINGEINLDGEQGRDYFRLKLNVNPTVFATPGPGGFAGGRSMTNEIYNYRYGGSGYGPGGAMTVIYGYDYYANGGSHASYGKANYTFNANAGAIMNTTGALYGDDTLIPLIGGSGGAGYNGNYQVTTAYGGGGGGAGGGAICIASKGTVAISGKISARGNRGGGKRSNEAFYFLGGCGSGGAVRILAEAISGTGNIDVCSFGGTVQSLIQDGWVIFEQIPDVTFQGCSIGGNGRIRLDSNNITLCNNDFSKWNVQPSLGNSNNVVLWSEAKITPLTLDNNELPQDPTYRRSGNNECIIFTTTGSRELVFRTENIPTNANVVVKVTPQYSTNTFSCEPIKATMDKGGTYASATWRAKIPLNAVRTTFQVLASTLSTEEPCYNVISREYTVGLGYESLKFLPDTAYVSNDTEFWLNAEFIQNPSQMHSTWTMRYEGEIVDSGEDDWENFHYDFGKPGQYDIEMHFTRPGMNEVILSKTYNVLDAGCTIHENKTISGNITWPNDGPYGDRIHVIVGDLIVKNKATLTIEPGAIVKFTNGSSMTLEAGSVLDISSVIMTHIADDEHGGDTNGDGMQTLPQFNQYKFNIQGYYYLGNYYYASVITDDNTQIKYATNEKTGTDNRAYSFNTGDSIVFISDDVTVPKGSTWEIKPGAIVKVAKGKSITVEAGGTLIANGTRAKPIIFTSYYDDEFGGDTDKSETAPAPGDWKFIYVKGTANLEYCHLAYGAPSNERGIIMVEKDASVTMNSCTVAHALYDGVWNWGGNLIMNNCIITDTGNAVAPYKGTSSFNHCVFYDNSHILMFWENWTCNPYFRNCVFKDMTVGWIEDQGRNIHYTYMFANCLFSSHSLSKPWDVGRNGNIWGDPLFVDETSMNFQLRPNSPCIDAGDGTVANLPQNDYYGNPRCYNDGHVTPTGVANAKGNYPDIGLFEMCSDIDSDLDIVLTSVKGPSKAVVGDYVTVRWQVANIGSVTASGSHRDNIYLVSKDERLGDRKVLVGTYLSDERVPAGTTMAYEFKQAIIPPVTPGRWAFAVFANEERDWFEGRNIDNNYLVSAGDCEITLPTVNCSSQGTEMIVNSGGTVGFQLTDVPAEGAMLVIRGESGVDITGQFGQLPESVSKGWKSMDLGNGTVLLTIPPIVAASDVFILLENSGNEDAQVEISTLTGPFALFDNGVTTASNSGTVTIPLYGIGLTEDMDVYLKQGKTRINALSLTAAENGAFFATFDVKDAATSEWTLYASNENGSDSLNALTLTQATNGPQWWCKLELPSAIRRGRTVVGTFVYGNSGDEDMDAPYIKMEGDVGVNIRLSDNDNWGKLIEFMALSATYPVSRLKAGEERRQTFEFIQLNSNKVVNIKYEYVSSKQYEKVIDSRTQEEVMVPTPFPWETNGKLMRPDWASDAEWGVILNRMKSAIGDSWNSCFDRMRSNADYLALLGQPTNDFGTLWQLDVREALAADNVVSTLASATDLVRQGRGMSIVVSRKFSTSMEARNYNGSFGKGWTVPYGTRVVLEDDGETLIFKSPSGSSYTFSKISGTWSSTVIGDKTELEANSSEYILRYQDGATVRFAKANGRIVTSRDCNGNGLDFTYSGDKLTKITHTDGQWVKFTYSGSYLSKAEDDLGHLVTYSYSGNRLASVTGITGLTTQYSYDNAANALKSITYPDGTSRDYTFDEMGRVATISINGNQQTVTIDRGSFGSYAIIDADGAVTETVVGASGEVLYTVDALGNKTICKYDNDVAAVTSIQTATGRSVHYEYDKDFNITRSVAPDGTATQFAYSVDFGSLESYTDARGQTVAYSYDDKGQGTGNTLADGKGGSLEYNAKGDVVSATDRSGKKGSMEYDAYGRLVRSTDADGRTKELFYDAKGNVVKVKDSLLGDTTMTYTAQERLKSITYADGRGFTYEYDGCGRLTKQTFSDGFAQLYEYDALGRISKMTDKDGKLLVSLAYDAVTGLPLSKTFGNGTSVHYTYDMNGNLLSITHKSKDGKELESFQYTYNADGQRTQVKSPEGVESYTYDLLGQLTEVNYPDGTIESFQYDAVGNRVSANGEAYTVNELNQYLTAGNVTFTYDDNGNMTSKTDADGTTTYDYDANSRLVRVVYPDKTEWSCQYDALGNRIQVKDNGQIRNNLYTFGEMSSLAAEYNASNKLVRRYVLLGNTLIADVDASGNYRYYHGDGLGSTCLLTNGSGSVVARQSYNVFGNIRTTTGQATRFGFVGTYGIEADSTGLTFMRNRYHDANIGRFTQLDPIGLQGKDTNWYRYCVHDGVNHVDAMGTSFWCSVVSAVDDFADSAWESAKEDFTSTVYGFRIAGDTAAIVGSVGEEIAKYKRNPELAAKFKAVNISGNVISKASTYYLEGETGVIISTIQDVAITTIVSSKGPDWKAPAEVTAEVVSLAQDSKAAIDWANADWKTHKQNIWKNRKHTVGLKAKLGCSETPNKPEPNKKEQEQTKSEYSDDPNEMVGPKGFGDEKTERFVTPGEELHYTVNFENKSSATAAAQEVFVNATLSPYLDWSTFQIESVLFSNLTEMGLKEKTRGKLLVDRQNTNQKVQIEVTTDVKTGKVRWYLRSVDPRTVDQWPESVYDGFLPPNDESHVGEGSVTYRVKVRDDAPHNARIDASAVIVFDKNEEIPTDPAWFNTVYAKPPADEFTPLLPDGTAMLELGSLSWENVAGAAEYDATLWKVVDGKEVKVGEATGLRMGYWDISEFAEEDTPGTTYHWQVIARNKLGITASAIFSFRTLGKDEQMGYALRSGWNLISVPFEINEETGGEILSMSPMVYERLQNAYVRATKSMKSGTAAWLFSGETKSIRIWTEKSASPQLPPELQSGWNLTGICGTQELLLDCEEKGVSSIWKWNGKKFTAVPIEHGMALLEPGVGYWVYLTE
ncbi:MAG: hypothetical protein J6X55_01200 [Victivallales bacterium]|nr:hypothetical protein [Victivallales bacterium]